MRPDRRIVEWKAWHDGGGSYHCRKRYTKRRIAPYYGASPDRISVVHNGSRNDAVEDPVTLQAGLGEERSVPGRITSEGGPFIEAAAVLKRFLTTFIMAGSGDDARHDEKA